MGGFFGGPSAPPPPAAPAVMPTADDQAVQTAKKKSLSRLAALGGRESTFLTSPFGSGNTGGTSGTTMGGG